MPAPDIPMPEAGSLLERPCPANHHIMTRTWYTFDEFNPECTTCTMRATLAFHDHLHLNPDEQDACKVPGINGTPGVSVKCRCGAFHH